VAGAAADCGRSELPAARDAGVLASEIASARGVSRGNVSALVSALMRKKLVRQVDDPADRRRKELQITARGKAALERIEPLRREVNTALFHGIDANELASTLKVLQRCLTTIRGSVGALPSELDSSESTEESLTLQVGRGAAVSASVNRRVT
jgi:DNA-binding MarR family transcriptional regulator